MPARKIYELYAILDLTGWMRGVGHAAGLLPMYLTDRVEPYCLGGRL
jgi:hypothetical protein